MTNQVIHGDCMDVLAEMDDNSIDTVITDPPYHLGSISKRFTKTSLGDDNDTATNARNGSNQYARLSTGFMGKSWDGGGIAFQPELWAEMLRVAKPGATLLAFGGTRTHHRLMVAIEDAGWEIRDCISHFHAADSREADLLDSMTDDQRQAYLELHYPGKSVHYLYGSGFPKSLSIGKSLDKRYKKKPEYFELAEFIKAGRKNIGLSQKDVAIYFPSKTGGLTGCVWNWENAINIPTQKQWVVLCRVLQLPDKFDWLIKHETIRWEEAKREVVGQITKGSSPLPGNHNGTWADGQKDGVFNITAPATEAAKTFDGFGTGLKPAVEPIILAMKPIESTYANNAQVWRVAGLNIDGARIGTETRLNQSGQLGSNGIYGSMDRNESFTIAQGRWPSNVLLSHSEGCVRRGERKVRGNERPKSAGKIYGATENKTTYGDYNDTPYKVRGRTDPNGLEAVADWECVDGCPIRILDEQAGVRKSGATPARATSEDMYFKGKGRKNLNGIRSNYDSGSASRFFYTAKAPNREKWFFCQLCAQAYPNKERDNHAHDIDQGQRKHIIAHPTTKPLTIMKYLATLTKTPTGGIVLDPFAGSGTTALACIETGRDFILIEKEADYYQIAKARVQAAMNEPRQAELF